MIDFSPFKQTFGNPCPGTGADLAALGFHEIPALAAFSAQVGGGVFSRGLLSVLSLREQVASLGGWERHLPNGARPFATSAFGLLLLTTGKDVWLADIEANDVFEADMSIEDALLKFTEDEVRATHLHEAFFNDWSRDTLELAPTQVLSLTPARALGGFMSIENLRETELGPYLSFTAQLFS